MTKLPKMRQLSDSSDQGVVYGYTEAQMLQFRRDVLEEAAEPVGYVFAGHGLDYIGCVISGTPNNDYVPVFASPQAVPAGFVLVPVEPTQEMCIAARAVPEPVKPYPTHFHLIWDAMLAAAPKGWV